MEIDTKQSEYINQRGIIVIYGQPLENEPFPYVTLREPQRRIEESEITFHRNSCGATLNKTHPTNANISLDNLVFEIEKVIADNMNSDGGLFKTKIGQPIKIFVIDNAWKEVAEKLADRYKPLVTRE